MNVKGQIALVTGASRGIGYGIAEALVKSGAIVIGTATTEEGAARIQEQLSAHGQAVGMVLNVRSDEACQQVFQAIVAQFGAPTILVNNAGITRDNLFLRMKEEEWSEVIDTHLNALFRLCKLAIKPMIKAHYGRIINISSAAAAMGNPGQANYAAAKAGMCGFSRALALEVASRQITVNVVAPGFIGTDMTLNLTEAQQTAMLDMIPAGHVGTPADIAQAVLFLASKEAGYITGQVLHVNGGMYFGN